MEIKNIRVGDHAQSDEARLRTSLGLAREEVKERPILFSAPMVRAILAGTKTQTRRVLKLQPSNGNYIAWFDNIVGRPSSFAECRPMSSNLVREIRCPYGAPGDRLWVRETWQAIRCHADGEVEEVHPIPKARGRFGIAYAATDEQADWHRDDRGFSWRPGIHMPRWASRITLEVTGVRVERVQAITEEDARAEGCTGIPDVVDVTPREEFQQLWDSINGKPRPMLDDDGEQVLDDGERPIMIAPQSWASNPWVWVVEFKCEQQVRAL